MTEREANTETVRRIREWLALSRESRRRIMEDRELEASINRYRV